VIIGGTISEITGGKFANGAETFAFMQMFTEVARYYEEAVGRKADPFPGANREPNDYRVHEPTGRQLPNSWDLNVIGFNDPLEDSWYLPGNVLKQGGLVGRVLNMVPTMNAIAAVHDLWLNRPGVPFTVFNNVATMLPAAVVGVGASFGNLMATRCLLRPGCRRPCRRLHMASSAGRRRGWRVCRRVHSRPAGSVGHQVGGLPHPFEPTRPRADSHGRLFRGNRFWNRGREVRQWSGQRRVCLCLG